MIIAYLIVMVVYAAVYTAYVNTHKDDVNLVDRYGDWEFKIILGLCIGALLWPFAIACFILYRIAYKFFEKK